MATLSEQVRSISAAYRTSTSTAANTLNDCARRIDEALVQISGAGPLGNSEDPNLVATRGHLAQAREMLKSAARSAEASNEPLTEFVDRLFPA